jgi:hypothetical protein
MPPPIIAQLPAMDKAAMAQLEKNATARLTIGKPAQQADAASVLEAILAERARRATAVVDDRASAEATVWETQANASLPERCAAALAALPPTPAERAALAAIAANPGLTVAALGKILGKKTLSLTLGKFGADRRHFFADPALPRAPDGAASGIDLVLEAAGCAATPATWTLRPEMLTALRDAGVLAAA